MQSTLVFLLVSATVVYGQSEYKLAYAVSDPLTGDHKSQKEIGVADGDVVAGQYKTLDADGLMRTVTYKADPLFGFRADVDRSPPAAIAPARIFKRQIPIAVEPLASPFMGGLYRSSAILPAATSFSSLRHLTRPSPVVMAAATPNWPMISSPSIIPALASDPLDWSSTLLKK